jgi:hypothetical protein
MAASDAADESVFESPQAVISRLSSNKMASIGASSLVARPSDDKQQYFSRVNSLQVSNGNR